MEKPNTVSIDIETSVEGLNIPEEKIHDIAVFACEKYASHPVELNIAVVDDKTISRVHSEFMEDDSTTDVISFDLTDSFEEMSSFQVIVNAEMAQRQAKERGHSFEAELCLYILHGLLHNLGFDDITKIEFEKMHTAEDDILSELGLGKVYRKE